MPLNMCCPVVVRGAFSPNVQIEISTNNQDEINMVLENNMKTYKKKPSNTRKKEMRTKIRAINIWKKYKHDRDNKENVNIYESKRKSEEI